MTKQRMSNAEAVMLCRMAKAACPQQQFDQYTPDMWHELLGDLRFVDAREALVEVVKAQPFVSPAEIRDQVKRVRGKRLDAFGPIIPPFELEGSPIAEREWIREMVRRVGDGELLPGQQPEVRELIGHLVPNWDELMPAAPRVTAAEIAVEAKPAKDADYYRRKDAARAELEPLRQKLAADAAEKQVSEPVERPEPAQEPQAVES